MIEFPRTFGEWQRLTEADAVVLAGRDDLTAERWMKLAQRHEASVDRVLAANLPAGSWYHSGITANVIDELVRGLLRHSDPSVRRLAVTHLPMTLRDQEIALMAVRREGNIEIALALASNPTVGHGVVRTLMREGKRVRIALASNPAVGLGPLMELTRDDDFDVRLAVWNAWKHDGGRSVYAALSEEFG